MSAVTGFKRLGLAVCVLILGVFGALAVVSFLIPKDQVREAVKAEIRSVTGLEPVLRGDVSVSLFPSGHVVLSDVTLGEGPGEPPLHASRVLARLSFLPLLTGQIEVSDITLAEPRIVVLVDAEGRSNWSPLVSSLTRAFDPKGKSPDSVPSFSEIRINGGTIVVRDDARKVYEYVSNADLSLAWPAISRSFAVTGNVRYRGETMEIGVTLGNFAAALQGDRSALKIRIGGEPFKFAFDGAMATNPTLKIEGTTSADSISLRRALLWGGRKPLPGGGFERFALKAQTNVVGGTIALSSVNLELDGNTAEGVITFAADGRQTLQGTLAADGLDLTPYLSTIRLLAASEREWSAAPLDLDGLTAADLDLRLSAAKITIGGAAFGRTAIAANLRAGKLGVTIGEARGFGGVIKGSLALAKAENGATFASQMQFDNVDLEKCIGELFGLRRIEGKGTLVIAIEGAGDSVQALTRTLDGRASLTSAKGALNGVNIEQLLRRLERRPLSGGNDFRSGRTPFEALAVHVKIAKGKATIDDITLRSPAVRVEMEGQASIPGRDLDLKGVATLVSASPADRKPFELPFVVQGPWDDPVLLPDAQSLIERSGAAAPLLDALRERRSREAVRSPVERPDAPPAAPGIPAPAEVSKEPIPEPAVNEAALPALPASPVAPAATEAAAPGTSSPASEVDGLAKDPPAEPSGASAPENAVPGEPAQSAQ